MSILMLSGLTEKRTLNSAWAEQEMVRKKGLGQRCHGEGSDSHAWGTDVKDGKVFRLRLESGDAEHEKGLWECAGLW